MRGLLYPTLCCIHVHDSIHAELTQTVCALDNFLRALGDNDYTNERHAARSISSLTVSPALAANAARLSMLSRHMMG